MELMRSSDGYYYLENDDLDHEALVAVWKVLAKSVLNEVHDLPWDHVQVEIWADSGRVILFPGNSSKGGRIDRSGCILVLRTLLSNWEQLADNQKLSDAGFDLAVLALVTDVAKQFDGQRQKLVCEGEIQAFPTRYLNSSDPIEV
jgi:hypothetical protein